MSKRKLSVLFVLGFLMIVCVFLGIGIFSSRSSESVSRDRHIFVAFFRKRYRFGGNWNVFVSCEKTRSSSYRTYVYDGWQFVYYMRKLRIADRRFYYIGCTRT